MDLRTRLAAASALAIIRRPLNPDRRVVTGIEMAFAFVFPGQGSQSVGMLAQLAGTEPVVQETFSEASDMLGYDLWKLCQSGPEEQLGATENTQPAMLTAGVATWRVWRKHGGVLPTAMAGHSLGEYSALVCSGALDFRTAVALVRFRGQAGHLVGIVG